MIFSTEERLVLLYDGANLHTAARMLNLNIEYESIRDHFASQSNFIRAAYYTAIRAKQNYSLLHPLIDWLDDNGFTFINKLAKQYSDGEEGSPPNEK